MNISYSRPHNSGHYTIESCEIDQFEMHLRAVLGLPCPNPAMRVGCAMMINILGNGSLSDTTEPLKMALAVPGAGVHWYGKPEAKPVKNLT
jgi:phosphoribosylaminoimidazole carboxylase (NCAIR synthetase)